MIGQVSFSLTNVTLISSIWKAQLCPAPKTSNSQAYQYLIQGRVSSTSVGRVVILDIKLCINIEAEHSSFLSEFKYFQEDNAPCDKSKRSCENSWFGLANFQHGS